MSHYVIRPLVNIGGDWVDTLPELATHWGVEEDGMFLVKDSKEGIMRAIGQLTSLFDHLDDTEAMWKETGRRPNLG